MALWPRLRPALGEYAYPAAYPASLLLFALATWYCGLLRVPVALALLVFVAPGSGPSGATTGLNLAAGPVWLVFIRACPVCKPPQLLQRAVNHPSRPS